MIHKLLYRVFKLVTNNIMQNMCIAFYQNFLQLLITLKFIKTMKFYMIVYLIFLNKSQKL